jgi:hypothetical protein
MAAHGCMLWAQAASPQDRRKHLSDLREGQDWVLPGGSVRACVFMQAHASPSPRSMGSIRNHTHRHRLTTMTGSLRRYHCMYSTLLHTA